MYTDVGITSPTIIRRKTPMAIGIPFEITEVLVVVFEGGIGCGVVIGVVDSRCDTSDE